MFHIIANWKMYVSYTEAVSWCQQHTQTISEVADVVHLGIIPDFTAIDAIQSILSASNVMIGAQNCSLHEQGAYTGEVAPRSLYELGCSACIIGHSERRSYHNETSEDVAYKAALLTSYHITPIICVGETEQERSRDATNAVLKRQLDPVVKHINAHHIYIAYEPRWAIGSGTTPSSDSINEAASYIRYVMQHALPRTAVTILYGGSVGPDNSRELSCIPSVDGFLIGSASCDFQKLQNIVYSVTNA